MNCISLAQENSDLLKNFVLFAYWCDTEQYKTDLYHWYFNDFALVIQGRRTYYENCFVTGFALCSYTTSLCTVLVKEWKQWTYMYTLCKIMNPDLAEILSFFPSEKCRN
jgi:hypothetical protein